MPKIIGLGEHEVLDAHHLTLAEREEFDYLDWAALAAGEDSHQFFRIGEDTYDLGEFSADYGITKGSGLPFPGWDGYMGESAFSAIVVKFVEDGETVRVARVLS